MHQIKLLRPEYLRIDGVDVIYRPRAECYVAVLDADYTLHFKNPIGSTWVARRPRALEPICSARSLPECVRLAKRHYAALAAERRASIKARLNHPDVVNVLATLSK